MAEDHDGQGRGEVEIGGFGAGHVGDERTEVAIADGEDEGGRAVDHLGADEDAAGAILLLAVVAGAGFAADGEEFVVAGLQGLEARAGGALLHDTHHGLAQDRSDMRRQDLLGFGGMAAEFGLHGRALGEVEAGDADAGEAHAAVQDDAGQLGERLRRIAGAAERGSVRGHEGSEGIALALPALVDFVKGLFFHQRLDAQVLAGLIAALE